MAHINPLREAFVNSPFSTAANASIEEERKEQQEKDLRAFLSARGITSVWHFTDKSNLPSIMEQGLLSLYKLITQRMLPKYSASSKKSKLEDVKKRLSGYVHLSFIQDHPLYHVALSENRIIDPVWIEIDLSVVFEPETRFCSQVANAHGSELFAIDHLQTKIDFDTMLFSRDFDAYKEARKAEILVRDRISPDKFIGVYDGK